jgi:thiamine pyrophosphokinase
MSASHAIIFANGDLPSPAALREFIQPEDILIAADGGLRHLLALGLLPALLIGDLDSVTPAEVEAAAAAGAEIRRYPPAKDETDLELALLAAQALGCTRITLAAALGGRLDQTLGNLFLLMLPELQGCDVRLYDGREEVFLIRQQAQIHGQAGDIVSLLPLNRPASGIWTEALRYPLRGETLHPERTRGISNVMLGRQAEVRLESGILLCIHTHIPKE